MNGRASLALLAALGTAETAVCLYGAHAQNHHRITTAYAAALVQAAPYAAACFLVWGARPGRGLFWVAMGFALAFRLVAGLNTAPYLSTDVYRYVWDGRVQAAGINPYRYPPDAPALASRRDRDVYPRVNRPDARTIYPPGAEAWFLVASGFGRGGVGSMRLAMVALEGIAIWALGRLLDGVNIPRQRLLAYAWHPLPVWEFAGSGHVDAAVIACVALALLASHRGRAGLVGLALAGATLVKLFPIALLPAFYRRWDWRLPAAVAGTVAAFYLPHLWAVGGGTVFDFLLHGYAAEEGIDNGDRFFGLALARRVTGLALPKTAFLAFAALVLGGTAVWCLARPAADVLGPGRRAAALTVAFTVLLSPGYAWYFAWLTPFLVLVPRPSLFWLTGASFVLYANWLHTRVEDFFVIGCVLYLPAAALFVAESAWSRLRPRLT